MTSAAVDTCCHVVDLYFIIMLRHSVFKLWCLFHSIQAKQWVNVFTRLGDQYQGYQRKYVTPYMHAFVFHVPDMMRHFGSLKQFSGQGRYSKRTRI